MKKIFLLLSIFLFTNCSVCSYRALVNENRGAYDVDKICESKEGKMKIKKINHTFYLYDKNYNIIYKSYCPIVIVRQYKQYYKYEL